VESESITHANDRDPPFAVLRVPHASRVVPDQERASILLTDEVLSAELLRMTDSFTDELFRLDPRVARSIVFPVSRLVVDPERFLDDSDESISSRGMRMQSLRRAARADLSARTAQRRVRLRRLGAAHPAAAIAFREGTLTERQTEFLTQAGSVGLAAAHALQPAG